MDAKTRHRITAEFVAGRFARAQEMLDAHLQAIPDDILGLAMRGTARLELGETEVARDELARASERAEAAGDAETAAFAELWLGYLHNRQADRGRAVVHFERAAALAPASADLCAALCQTYAEMGRDGPASEWGAKSLALRSGEGSCPDSDCVPRARPRSFDPTARRRNLLSFSLFGDDAFYRECAVTVARSARGVFPEFSCRFYCGPEIPEATRKALAAAGAQVMVVTPKALAPQHPFAGLLWRFLAFDDPNVDVALVRDVDSPFTLRERGAIDLWLGGDAPFVTVRDHLNHTEPLMAGMWGGFTGLLPPLAPVVARFHPPDRSRYVDQLFLRHFVWPRIRGATLAIDSVYAMGGSVRFPDRLPGPDLITAGIGWQRRQIIGPG